MPVNTVVGSVKYFGTAVTQLHCEFVDACNMEIHVESSIGTIGACVRFIRPIEMQPHLITLHDAENGRRIVVIVNALTVPGSYDLETERLLVILRSVYHIGDNELRDR